MNFSRHIFSTVITEKHLDFFGHVNNAVYVQLYEEARWDWIVKHGLGLEYIKTEKKGPVVLSLQVNFFKELKNRTSIWVTTEVKEIKKNLIILLEQKILLTQKCEEKGYENLKEEMSSLAKFEIGIMDLEKRRLIPPPENWLLAFGKF